MVSWQFIPFHSLIYQGGVRQIPRSMYEAAEIDGAGRVRQFFSITLPQLKYTIITSSTLMVVGSLTFFDLIFVLTAGGPGDATRVLALDMYKRGFQANLMGPASAIAVILVLVGLALALLLRRLGGGSSTPASWKGPDVATTLRAETRQSRGEASSAARARRGARRRNWLGGLAGWLWLVIVMVPIYWIVITSFKTQSNYYATNPLVPPTEPTLDNYRLVIESDFVRYFVNSVIVTLGAVVPGGRWSPSWRPSRSSAAATGRFLRSVNSLFLMGLAIPLQATVIPVYLIIIRLQLYDTLLAIILPSIAFAIPLSVLVLSNFIRDVPKELFESMRVDGATEWGTLWRLAFPLTRPALVTVTIYNGLTIWNGFLLPLILTQSPNSAPCRWLCGPSRASTASTCRPCSPRSSSPRCRS